MPNPNPERERICPEIYQRKKFFRILSLLWGDFFIENMSITESKIKPFVPDPEYVFPVGAVVKTHIRVDGDLFPHYETTDFSRSDPWSLKMRRSARRVRESGGFDGEVIRELGIGDGRNIREAGRNITGAEGVDVDSWRLEAASRNLIIGEKPLSVDVRLWHGDAVDFLREQQGSGRERFRGWVLMCLPQSPEGINAADKYNGNSNLDPYRDRWEESGLTLNAAALDNLRKIADKNLRALVIISNRVPPKYRNDLIVATGWEIESKFKTEHPIQQDPDTGTAWVERIDDGKRFFQKTDGGLFVPVSATEAEHRRKRSFELGKGRADLNVYHHLTVYELKPN